MIPEASYYGRSRHLTLAENESSTIHYKLAGLWTIDGGVGSSIILVDAAPPTDHPGIHIFNVGLEALGVIDERGALIHVLEPGKALILRRGGLSPLYPSLVKSMEPIGYWRLGESSGNVAYDLSSNGFVGNYSGGVTLNQSGALAEDPDTAVAFDGSTGRVEIPHNEILDLGGDNPATWLMWIKKTTLDDNSIWFLGKGYPSTGELRYLIQVYGDTGSIAFATNNGTWNSGTSNLGLDFSGWRMIAVVWNGVDTVSFYYDGQLVGTLDFAPSNFPASSRGDELRIGGGHASQNNDNLYHWYGVMDEVSIFDRALSGTEINRLFTLGSTGELVGLEAGTGWRKVERTLNTARPVNSSTRSNSIISLQPEEPAQEEEYCGPRYLLTPCYQTDVPFYTDSAIDNFVGKIVILNERDDDLPWRVERVYDFFVAVEPVTIARWFGSCYDAGGWINSCECNGLRFSKCSTLSVQEEWHTCTSDGFILIDAGELSGVASPGATDFNHDNCFPLWTGYMPAEVFDMLAGSNFSCSGYSRVSTEIRKGFRYNCDTGLWEYVYDWQWGLSRAFETGNGTTSDEWSTTTESTQWSNTFFERTVTTKMWYDPNDHSAGYDESYSHIRIDLNNDPC